MDFSFLQEKVATGEEQTYFDWILSGAGYTVAVSLSAFIVAMALGITIGSLRTTSGIKAKLANAFFEAVRSVPFIALLFINFYVLPYAIAPSWIKTADPNTVIFTVGILSPGVFMSSRIAAQVYAGIKALPEGQALAAKALGFSQAQAYTRFLIPQALKNITPSLTSEAMNTVKNSAVVSAIGLTDLTKQAQTIIDYTAKPIEAFTCIVLGYLLINWTVLLSMKLVEGRNKKTA